jgi:hypothetical protein
MSDQFEVSFRVVDIHINQGDRRVATITLLSCDVCGAMVLEGDAQLHGHYHTSKSEGRPL